MPRLWEGVEPNNQTFDDVTWEQVEQALRRLDGRRHTQLVLDRTEVSNLVVGGGKGRYNVFISTADHHYYTLTDPSKGGGTEPLVVGGQLGEYPAETVVSLPLAIRAARVFL